MKWKRRKPNLSWQKIDTLMIGLMMICSVLLLTSIIGGFCPVAYVLWRTKKREVIRHVVLLGYARSGSSYLGDLLASHTDVFYSYEPLDALYVALYGTREGWNCHSDITYFSNGTERIPPQREMDEVSQYMHSLLNCQTERFHREIWLHGFWQKYSQYHVSLRPFVACLVRNGVDQRDFSTCQNHLSARCCKRLDWTRIAANNDNKTCPVGVLNQYGGQTSVAYQEYEACVGRLELGVARCRQSFAESCRASSVRMAKTVRMTMETVERLLEHNPDLRIIHLIRDPRAVAFSRASFDPSVHGLYAGRPMNLVREATGYCSIVRRDIVKRKQLELRYPAAFMEVLYEQLVADPETLARRIYNFVGISFDSERIKWLEETRKAWKRDPEQWRKHLQPHVVRSIDRVCIGLYEYIAYN